MVNQANFDRPLSKAEKRRAAGKKPKATKPLKDRIPVPPPRKVDGTALVKPDQRAVACVNLRLAGASFVDIANELHYSSPLAAETAYVSALAGMYPVSNWEVLRQEAALRAELLLKRSLAMAQADYLVDADHPKRKLPNPDRLRWHEQAGKDLTLLVNITGAKAPSRIELSADTQELNHMVAALLVAQGGPAEIEADVFDIDEIEMLGEDIEDADVVEDRDD